MTTATSNLMTLNMKRTYPVSAERLFKAWTDPEQVIQWFGCKMTVGKSAKIDKEVGGDYHIHMNSPHIGETTMEGTIKAYEPFTKLAFTFVFTGNQEGEKMPFTLVTLTFKEVDAGTEMELVHSEIPCDELRQGFTQGWTESMEKLAKQVA